MDVADDGQRCSQRVQEQPGAVLSEAEELPKTHVVIITFLPQVSLGELRRERRAVLREKSKGAQEQSTRASEEKNVCPAPCINTSAPGIRFSALRSPASTTPSLSPNL